MSCDTCRLKLQIAEHGHLSQVHFLYIGDDGIVYDLKRSNHHVGVTKQETLERKYGSYLLDLCWLLPADMRM